MGIYEDVYEQLSTNGAMGVNALSKALNIPLSTMQKYMDKDQNYFKKNFSRKWELPEESVKADMSHVSGNIGNIIDSQLLSMDALINTLMSQFRATITLLETNKASIAPVAAKSDNSVNSHRSITKLYDLSKMVANTVKDRMSDIPEEYQDLLKNTDWVAFITELGIGYTHKTFSQSLASVILKEKDTLPDIVVKQLEDHQKGA